MKKSHPIGESLKCDFFALKYLIIEQVGLLSNLVWNYLGIVTQKDLARGKVASIEHSVSDKYLKNRRIYPMYYENIVSGLEAVKNGSVDAMVYDAPLLQYYINHKFRKSLTLTGAQFETQNYSIIVPQGSKRLEKINQALLEIVNSPEWEDILHRYLDYSQRSK